MKNSTGTVRLASSYRQEAREALRGRWGAALLTCLLLAILPVVPFALFALTPSLIQQDGIAALSALAASAMTHSPVQAEQLAAALGSAATSVVLLCAVVSLLVLILQPFLTLGQAKMGVNLYTGDPVGFRVLGIGWKSYWKTVGLNILTYLAVIWPLLLASMLGAVAVSLASQWIGNYALVGNDPAWIATLISVAYAVLMLVMMCVTVARAFRYVGGIYLLAMHPDGSIVKIMRRSRAIMHGNRWRFFCLNLSFIGWMLLNLLFNAAVVAALSMVPASSTLLWLIAAAISLLPLLTSLPLTAYQQVSVVAFICDVGSKKHRRHAE